MVCVGTTSFSSLKNSTQDMQVVEPSQYDNLICALNPQVNTDSQDEVLLRVTAGTTGHWQQMMESGQPQQVDLDAQQVGQKTLTFSPSIYTLYLVLLSAILFCACVSICHWHSFSSATR